MQVCQSHRTPCKIVRLMRLVRLDINSYSFRLTVLSYYY